MKKLLVLLASAAGAFAITKQIKDKQAENKLWAEATDTPRS
ncbi:DLW-39 family protein [Phycicoccus flavus]|nr:DLW-39 family protein [Phycicoccus flavus]